MFDLTLLVAFLAAISVLTMTPGVDTVLVLQVAMVDGRRPAIVTAMGIALGCLVWGAAVSLGLGALLQTSEMAYALVKLAGAAYLVWLGAKLLIKPRVAINPDACGPPSRTSGNPFWRGFLSNLLNPKVGVFYITFLPQFIPAGTSVAGYSFFLACLHVVLTLIWFSILVTAMAPLSKFLCRPSALKTLDRLTGGIFVAFGIKLATSPH